MNAADWAVEGAQVAEYTHRSYEPTAMLTTVERLTATQIVLASGRRYRRDTLRPVGNRYNSLQLCPVTDERVRDALARQHLRTVSGKVDALMRDYKGGVTAVLATLDEIERAVAEARAAITKLSTSP